MSQPANQSAGTGSAAGNGSAGRRIPWDDYLAMHAREIVLGVLALAAIVFAFLFVEIPGGNELTGSVSSGGRPVVYGTVTVVASDDRVYTAPIRADGTYRIPAVPPGPVRVAVSSPNPRSIVEQVGAAESAAGPPPARSAAAGPPPAGQAGKAGARAATGGRSPAAEKDPAADSVSVAAPNGTAPPFPAPVPPKPREQDRQQGWFRIPGRYASPATSGIRTEVRRGRTPLDIRVD